MDELLGIRVPQSLQAEQAVIGSMLIDPDCIPDVLKDTRAEHFYNSYNRDVFETIFAMFNYGMTIDPITIMEQMKERGVFHEDSTRAYLIELMQITPTAANVSQYVSIIRDKALQRDLGKVAGEITQMVNEGLGSADDMLEKAERDIYALRRDRSIGGLKPISEVVREVYDNLNRLAQEGGQIPGVPTGFVDLDRMLLGLNPGELVLIAARPGMGKTAIALNIAMNAAKEADKAIAIFSLEMTRTELVSRILSAEAGIDGQKLHRGNLSAEEWRRIVTAASTVSSTNVLINDNSTITVTEIAAQCRRVSDLGLVVVDYLQLISSAGGKQNYRENRERMVAEMTRMLKVTAKELGVPVLCLCQLSREAEKHKETNRPRLSDLRESGAIEQDADVVIALYREGQYNSECEDPYAAEAIVLKNRKGKTGIVDLRFIPEYTSYVSVEQRYEQE